MELKDIKELIRFFDKSGVAELEIEQDDVRLYLSKTGPQQVTPQMMPQGFMPPQMQAAPVQEHAEAPQPAPVIEGNTIESPMIGTYYESPSPGAAPFVKTGDIVEKGQTLCIIEAMKIMNTIEADYRCKILKVLVGNGKPVEYAQPIYVVEPL